MPGSAGKNAYSMPLIVAIVHATAAPSRVRLTSAPDAEAAGSIARRLREPVYAEIVKLKPFAIHDSAPNDEPLRPSIQFSICLAETTGTPCACAEATMASEPAWGHESKCMFAVNTP